jgi:CheY-like chemotaxis protein
MNRIIASGAGECFEGLNVLITEDSPATRRVFKMRLEELGMTVVEAADGQEALEYLQKDSKTFDMIFCDIQMPRMDGYDLCKTLSEADWFTGIPIVMVSTCSDAKEVIKALKLGADDYIPKPFEHDLLIKVIKRVRS